MNEDSLKSGAALLLDSNTQKETLAGKIQMVMNLLGGKETCPTCGHEAENTPLITIDEAKKLLEDIK